LTCLKVARPRRRFIVLAVLLAASSVALLAAPSSFGSTVMGQNFVIADPGEQNVITVTQSGGSFVITDTAGISVGQQAPCSQDSATQVTCTGIDQGLGLDPPQIYAGDLDDRVQLKLSSTRFAFVEGGDGNDQLDATGSTVDTQLWGDEQPKPTGPTSATGADVIRGGPRKDLATGGPGNDQVFGNDGHDFLKGLEGADLLDGGEGDDLIATWLDPPLGGIPIGGGFDLASVDDNTVDTVICGGNAPPAALSPGDPGTNPALPPTDAAQTGQGDLVGADCEQLNTTLTCPSGTCTGLPTVTTTAGAGAATAVAAAAGKGKTKLLGRARRQVKVKKGQRLLVAVTMNRKAVKKAFGKRPQIPARLGLQSRKSKKTGRKVRFKLKR
jgi:Ca2+-binding RTX toxin-like protein